MVGDRLRDEERLLALDACGALDAPTRPHLDRITELTVDMTGAPVSLVSLVDDHRQFFASQQGLTGWAADQRQTPLTHSFCQYVVTTDEPLVVADARLDPVLRSNLAVSELGVVAYCGVPIRTASGLTLGSLVAIDGEPRAWTANDVALLTGLADAVSAELDIDARYRRLTVDLHRRLLPTSLPTSPSWEVQVGYRPLDLEVGLGGDLYDVVPGPDGSVTLVVGDIVGHDADAAIAMGQLRSATLALVHAGASLAEVATALDATCRSVPGLFCSAWVAVRVEPGIGRARYLSAGAIAPILVSADGVARYLDEVRSPPIGVSWDRTEGEVAVQSGDLFVLCTDGLVEDRRSGIDAGLDRVLTQVASGGREDLSDLVDRLVRDRVALGGLEDDLAVLACRLR